MGLKDVDLESALRRLAERRIEEAMREGKFDNLPGAGKPLDLEPMPADENARLTWWALRIMRTNDFTPDEVRWRKQIETLKDELSAATSEARVVVLVKTINGLVRQLNTMGTNAIRTPVTTVSLEDALRRVRERQAVAQTKATDETTGQCGNERCGMHNPASAHFCRRCGLPLWW